MKYLLDTHVLLWASAQPHKLSSKARAHIEHKENEIFFSPASLWEIVIKHGLGRSDFHVNASVLRRALIDNGYKELFIRSEHTVAISSLPPLHKDPFDHILITQAMVEGIILLTADRLVAQYPGPIEHI